MKIEVTAEHIRDGERSQPSLCPVALALRQRFGCDCHVGSHTAVWVEAGGRFVVDLPESATKFVNEFDAGLAVEPFGFAISDTPTFTP